MNNEPKRLGADDWAALFPERAFKIGSMALRLQPLNIEKITAVAALMYGIRGAFQKRGITKKNFRERLVDIAQVIVTEAPEIVEIASGLHRDDVRMLPVGTLIELMQTVVDINTASYEGLEKNLIAALGLVSQAMPLVSLMFSTGSSAAATRGETSGDTPPRNSENFSGPASGPKTSAA